jgi:uncharacterized protein (TIGR03083 family)
MTMMDEPGEGDLNGAALLEAYASFAREMAQSWKLADPKVRSPSGSRPRWSPTDDVPTRPFCSPRRACGQARLKWFGPDMSVRSSLTARLMETWSHAQAVYDVFGVERINSNQIRNVAHIGWTTFGFCFGINELEVPPTPPMLRLTSPAGADDAGEVWEWGEDDSAGSIIGTCEEFCQVVTQTRNIQDVGLAVTGEAAEQWMAVAQCFAGPPNPPPEPGTRFMAREQDLLVAKL